MVAVVLPFARLARKLREVREAAGLDVVPYRDPETRKEVPGLVMLEPNGKRTAAGCVVVPSMEELDRVYVILPSNGYGPWSFPKGRVIIDESVRQAAVRETEEETGLKVRILPGEAAYLGSGEGRYSVTHYYLAVRTGGSPQPTDETEQVIAVTWERAIALFFASGNSRDLRIADRARKALAANYQ